MCPEIPLFPKPPQSEIDFLLNPNIPIKKQADGSKKELIIIYLKYSPRQASRQKRCIISVGLGR
jgi:hypothetical protein